MAGSLPRATRAGGGNARPADSSETPHHAHHQGPAFGSSSQHCCPGLSLVALGLVPGVESRPCFQAGALSSSCVEDEQMSSPPAPTSAFPALFNGCDCNRRGLFCHRRCLVVHRAGWVSQASGASLGAYSHLELVYVGKRFCHPNNSHRKEF